MSSTMSTIAENSEFPERVFANELRDPERSLVSPPTGSTMSGSLSTTSTTSLSLSNYASTLTSTTADGHRSTVTSEPTLVTSPSDPDANDHDLDSERTVSPVRTTSIHTIVTQTQSRSLSLQMFSNSSHSHISHSVLSNVGRDVTTTTNNHYHINISGPTTVQCHPDHIHPVLEVGAAGNLEQDPESARRRLVERAQDIPPELKHAQAPEGLFRRRSVGEVPGNTETIREETRAPSFAGQYTVLCQVTVNVPWF
ncbi:hypothetical protein D9758_009690 [Tetrapyrgos nigripes]|uniref:Uncharacterized protein n=1 Tax=Tetrapyrgos nigripes TaxID=182062 RepID=A0A8H5FPT6_9AGAR|nr:hypothetical protein D9758_009690 [Tetrapyrgos nigripes]